MGQIAVTGEPADRNEVIARYDLDEAARTAFGMHDGERVVMSLKVDADLMNVVVDSFNRDVNAVLSEDGETATVTVPVRESPVLFGWLATLGDGAEVLRPKALRDGYADWLRRVLDNYEG